MPRVREHRPAPAVVLDEVDEVEQRLRRGLIVDLDTGFGEVGRVHERVVHSVALRLSTTRADAEDVAAETFLRAYRALLRYDAGRVRTLRIRPGLLTILRNTARNAARDAGRRPGPPPDVGADQATRYLDGLAAVDERMVMVLSLEQLAREQDNLILAEAA